MLHFLLRLVFHCCCTYKLVSDEEHCRRRIAEIGGAAWLEVVYTNPVSVRELWGEVGNQQRSRTSLRASLAEEEFRRDHPHPEVLSHVCLYSCRTSASLCCHHTQVWGKSADGMGKRFFMCSRVGLNPKHLFYLLELDSLPRKSVSEYHSNS